MNSRSIKVLIAASGSGGHLFPALLIARALKRKVGERYGASVNVQIEFVGTGRPLEAKLVDGAGYKRHVIELEGVQGRGVSGLIGLFSCYPQALRAVWKLFSDLKPDVVIGVGGYASVLPVLVARLRGVPSWIHEAEVNPGLANWTLSFIASRVSVGFDKSTIWWRKVLHLGHPVREELAYVLKREVGVPPKRILALGGSQGAAAIDDALAELSPFLKERGVHITHQTRPENVEHVRSVYVQNGVQSEVLPFIDDMIGAYSKSDIIISRAGAASVTEIAIVNRPAIFVPLPSSQGGHQVVNARYLVDKGKALLVVQGEGFSSRLKEGLEKLLNPEFYNEMLGRPFSGRSVSAASDIASGCLNMLKT